MIELTTSWISHLKNADHVGITTQIYDAIKETNIANDMYRLASEALAKAISDEDEAYKKTLKDWVAEQLKEADNKQDGYMKCIRSLLTGHAALPDGEPTKQPAVELLQLWKEYKFSFADSYSGESSKVINMYQEVEKRQSDAENLGIWAFFGKAKAAAQQVQALLTERFEGMAERTVGEMRMARTATDTVIKQAYQVLEGLQAFAPSGELTELMKKLRAIEDYARVYYLKTSASSGDDTPNGGGGSTGGGSAGNPNVPPVGGGD